MEKADLNGVSIVIYREERARVFAGGGGEKVGKELSKVWDVITWVRQKAT